MADDIILNNEAAMEAAKSACVAAVEAYVAMTTEQRAEHDAAQTTRILAEFQALTPEQQAQHESAHKLHAARAELALGVMNEQVLTPLNDSML
jgi:Spy/CpxP family protein refolding chaperone